MDFHLSNKSAIKLLFYFLTRVESWGRITVMSKKKEGAKATMSDRITCPYCGRTGVVIRVYEDKSVDVSHVTEERDVISQATGKAIRCGVFVDGCSRHGKLGLIGRSLAEPAPVGVEEDLINVIEEDL